MFDNLTPEVAAVIANTPALQDFFAAERLKAETAAQEALNEQQRLAQKQVELDELRRKNDIEEQRNRDIQRIIVKIDQMLALTTGITDAYIEKHHDPLYAIMQSVLTQLGLLLQSHNIILPEHAKRLGDPRLEAAALQLYETMIRQVQPPQGKSSSISIYAGDAPTTLNAPGSNIHRMNIGDQ